MSRPVLLLHGLWFNGVSLWWLGRRLRALGFRCGRFDYATVGDTPQRSVERLCDVLRAAPDGCDVVAHSLGGLLALQALRHAPQFDVGRVVCLGSPLAGSATAAALARWGIGPRMLGHSARLLQDGIGDWYGRAEVGVIAGDRPLGLGRLVGTLPPPHDGTVTVAETRVGGLRDHIVLPTSHTGMLFSDEVARQAAAFLRHGRFEHR